MPRYRLKSVEVDAVQWTGGNVIEIAEFSREAVFVDADGLMTVAGVSVGVGDWLMRDGFGLLTGCPAARFEAEYERV